ncbi:MAG: ParA family protein [Pseudomonadales bacterium]|nr:ParA family protein [Pseudomonadales bacterium]
MRVWSVANQKGGVGKTTTVVALGSLLAASGKRVLMLDLDPQGSLSSYFRLQPDTLKRSSYELFVNNGLSASSVAELVLPMTDRNLSLLPASTSLATLERSLPGKDGMGLAVAKGLSLLWDDYDHVLIDTPPTLGVLLINALAACEKLLIPVQTEFLALKGLERMMNTLQMVMRSQQKNLSYLIIPTLFDRRTQAGVNSLRSLRSSYPDSIWQAVIPVDTRLRDASAKGVTPVSLDPDSRGLKAYRALLKAVM